MIGRRPIDQAALFLVSGGARGVTARCVVELARRYRCRFLLLGRSRSAPEPAWALDVEDDAELKRRAADALRAAGSPATPTEIGRACAAVIASREIASTLAAVEAAGGQAEYLSADVTDAAALRAALEPALARLGAPTALLHGAGALADRPVERKSEADYDRVYAAKVDGLSNLLAIVPPDRLDHLVLFSSAAGFFGNPGQSDYALANEILNRAARLIQRANPRARVVALDWGPWAGGMVTPELARLFAERGLDLIPLDEGARTLIEVLEHPSEPVQVVVGGRLAGPPLPPRTPGRTLRLKRRLHLGANPFLMDHVVGGNAVLPAVCAIQWIANAAEQLRPGYRIFAADDFRILKGIVFDGQQAEEYVLELVEREAEGEGLGFDGRVWSTTPSGQTRYHYSGRLTLLPAPPPPPVYAEADLRQDERAREGAGLYLDGTLFHGPSFRGVRRLLNASPTRLTLECVVPTVAEAAQGQFPVQTFDPFFADAQFQSQVIWTRLFHDAASLPLSCRRGEQYMPPPVGQPLFVSMEVRSSSEHGLVSDTIAHDASGRVYGRVLGAEVTISRQLNPLFQPAGR